MGANKAYEELLEARSEIEERTNRLVGMKLACLRDTGRSVLLKKLGYDWGIKDLKYLDNIGIWLSTYGARVTGISKDSIEFSRAARAGVTAVKFTLERKFLHMSDRDFAKYLRKELAGEKLYRANELIASAAKVVSDSEKEIAKKNMELLQLQARVVTQKKKLAEQELATQAAFAK